MARLARRHHASVPFIAGLTVAIAVACGSPGTASGPPSARPSSSATTIAATTPPPAPTPTMTIPGPTATAAAAWTNLAWSMAVKSAAFGLADVVPWRDGYVGIGQAWDADGPPSSAFFASDDGLIWRMTQRLDGSGEFLPRRVITTDSGLLAVIDGPVGGSGPTLWASADGASWAERTSPTWTAAWATDRFLTDVAIHASTIAAVVRSPGGPEMLISVDAGLHWQAVRLPGEPVIEARSVTSTVDGFVLVGVSAGQPDDAGTGVRGGRSAAWTSADGLAWQPADVAASADADAFTFARVVAGRDGYVAIAADVRGTAPSLPSRAWASTDGTAWSPLGVLGTVVPRGSLAGDGVRMLDLDPGAWSPFDGTPWPGYERAWTSSDGRAWTPVTFSGQLMDQESFDGWWLTPTGLVFSGTDRTWTAAAT